MEEHLRRFGKYGLTMATFMLPIITTDKGIAVDMNASHNDRQNVKIVGISSSFVSDKSRNKLNKRLRDVVYDMNQLKYI